MIAAASWLCLLAPLAAAILITLAVEIGATAYEGSDIGYGELPSIAVRVDLMTSPCTVERATELRADVAVRDARL